MKSKKYNNKKFKKKKYPGFFTPRERVFKIFRLYFNEISDKKPQTRFQEALL